MAGGALKEFCASPGEPSASMAEEKHNRKNPAVKRILRELKEMQDNPSDDFMSLPLEDNIFEWQFAIRGSPDSEFAGGIYHGRIQLPMEYPFKPPSFMLLTPNGRFETQTKICLSISNHHPEHWQPSWSVRTALVALIAFMPTDPGGALGSLDYTKEERQKLAIKSRVEAPKYGSPERQILIDEIHQYMLSKVPPVGLPPLKSEQQGTTGSPASPGASRAVVDDDGPADGRIRIAEPEVNGRIVENVREVRWNAHAGPLRIVFSARMRTARRVPVNSNEQPHLPEANRSWRFNDQYLTFAAVGLTLAIMFLLLKKLLKANGYHVGDEDRL